MDKAKIRLSQVETELVNNAEWILTKNAILEKVKQLLGRIQVHYRQELESLPQLPPEIRMSTPKISKGENYKGLPYLVLDYPRCFKQEEIFAIRTLFWWGHFFSITLQLSGHYKKRAEEKIIRSFPMLAEKDYFICIAEDPWEHHFEEDNYVPLSRCKPDEFEKRIREKPFIKLAVKTALQQWDDCEEIMPHYFQQLTEIALP